MSRMGGGVQTGIIVAGAFVVGMVVGGLSPRAQVRTLEDQVFELERQRARSGSATGRQFTELLTRGLSPREEEETAPAEADGEGPAGARPRPRPRPERPEVIAEGDPVGGDAPFDEDASLEMARETLAVRAAQARAALDEDIRPTPAQRQQIDAAIGDMNAELELLARDFVDAVRAQGEPSRLEMMMTGADVLDVLVQTETRMLDLMDADQREAVREGSTDPTAYIDPVILDIAYELQGMDP